MTINRGSPSKNSVFGKFYPACPYCQVASVVDGWCHHIDAPQSDNSIRGTLPYCGRVVCNNECPLQKEGDS